MTHHRVEVLERAADARMESWSNPSGDVLLVRHRGASSWTAFVDFVPVLDAELLNGPLAFEARGDTEPDVTMRAPDLRALATRLALQERLHLVFAPSR